VPRFVVDNQAVIFILLPGVEVLPGNRYVFCGIGMLRDIAAVTG